MPQRRSTAIVETRDPIDAVSVFKWSTSDDFTSHALGYRAFPSRSAAQRAWPRHRRETWAATHRMGLPHAARVFDVLTKDGWEFIWTTWQHVGPFRADEALQAIAADRAAVDAFERRDRGARTIADFLDQWRDDLSTLEAIARELGAWRGDSWLRPGPTQRMTTATKYGDPRKDGHGKT